MCYSATIQKVPVRFKHTIDLCDYEIDCEVVALITPPEAHFRGDCEIKEILVNGQDCYDCVQDCHVTDMIKAAWHAYRGY